jgi:transcriptional regulator with XRE-family HTH domain
VRNANCLATEPFVPSTPDTRVSRLAIREGDRQLRNTTSRFGDEVRQLRLRAGVSQAAVARAVGVHRSVVCRIEAGNTGVGLRTRARVAAVVGGDLRLVCYGGASPILVDAAHARLSQSVLDMCHSRWRITVEAPVPGPGRRSSDLRLSSGPDIVLIEIETHVRSLEAIIRECQEKRVAVATRVGAARVHIVLALPRTRHHQAIVRAHPTILATAFPIASSRLEAAMIGVDGRWPGDGVLWLATSSPSRRRPPAPGR